MRIATVIPWRSSGDPDRDHAHTYTVAYYQRLTLGPVISISDGRRPGQPFNRHAAYNRGLALAHDTDIILWNEADTLIPQSQIQAAAQLAEQGPGLVIPYTERHELDATQTSTVYAGTNPLTLIGRYAVYPDGTSIGQAGVTSRTTITLIGGWDERFQGWGYDDNAMHHVFDTLAGPTRWVQGKGIHLWHQPEHQKPRTTHSDSNAQRCAQLLAITDPTQLRQALTPTP